MLQPLPLVADRGIGCGATNCLARPCQSYAAYVNVGGYGWSAIAPPLVVVGDPDDAALRRVHELGATLAAGLLAGIF